jgi:hypothetical protein
MTKRFLCTPILALTLLALTAAGGRALAQSASAPPPTNPSIVTGTDPGPDYVRILLALLLLG